MMNEAAYFNRVKENVGKLKLLSIFMEVILIGLALAVATAWGECISVSSEFLLSEVDVSPPVIKLISASIITAFAMLLAGLTVFYFYVRPRKPPTPPASPKCAASHTPSSFSSVPPSRRA